MSSAEAWYVSLAVAAVLFAFYGSLLPFEFQPIPFGEAWDRFRAAALAWPAEPPSRTDVIANVLLYVPIGFALAGAFVERRRGAGARLGAALGVVVGCALLSLAAEFLQTFAQRRVPSGVDIAAQAAGASVGVVAWTMVGRATTAWLVEARAAAPADRLGRVLAAYAAAWMFVNLAPFDLTVDLGELAARYRSGQIVLVPFSRGMPASRQAWDVLAGLASAVPLGLALVVGWRGGRTDPLAALVWGSGLVAAIELAQVFIASHAADATDVLSGLAGVAIGVAAGSRLRPVASGAGVLAPSAGGSRWAAAATAAWCGVIAAYHWLPYDFTADPQMLRTKLDGLSLMPFAAYGAGSYLNALNDLLVKLAVAAPLGLGAAFATRQTPRPSGPASVGWFIAATAVFAAVEAGQLFLPTRTPDVTDVITGACGTLLGLSAGRWLRIRT